MQEIESLYKFFDLFKGKMDIFTFAIPVLTKSLKAKKDPIVKEIEQEFPVSILWVIGFVPIVIMICVIIWVRCARK